MKTNDYVKYLTQTVVKYIDQPKEERQKMKQAKKEAEATFMFRWFGILPFMLMSSIKKKKN
ncbi:YqzE family protein [Mesobacillus sp. LC4]|uniref:YqzE family protein n=1 Tax=Mesobacillus selenatarsenatis TaxID=388741 RepID=A0A846TE60_9BACI|nr:MULTISPECIES: YqzE family protein [Mesobacillus]NKE05069.1 YqzE family protein [Mesobacillus selenatarsenatis]